MTDRQTVERLAYMLRLFFISVHMLYIALTCVSLFSNPSNLNSKEENELFFLLKSNKFSIK